MGIKYLHESYKFFCFCVYKKFPGRCQFCEYLSCIVRCRIGGHWTVGESERVEINIVLRMALLEELVPSFSFGSLPKRAFPFKTHILTRACALFLRWPIVPRVVLSESFAPRVVTPCLSTHPNYEELTHPKRLSLSIIIIQIEEKPPRDKDSNHENH